MGWEALKNWGANAQRIERLTGGVANNVWSLRVDGRLSVPFDWAVVGLDAIDDVAAAAGMRVVSTRTVGTRHTATMVRDTA